MKDKLTLTTEELSKVNDLKITTNANYCYKWLKHVLIMLIASNFSHIMSIIVKIN